MTTDGATWCLSQVLTGKHGRSIWIPGHHSAFDWRVTRWTIDLAMQGYIVKPHDPLRAAAREAGVVR